jgi:hypothetical protein
MKNNNMIFMVYWFGISLKTRPVSTKNKFQTRPVSEQDQFPDNNRQDHFPHKTTS